MLFLQRDYREESGRYDRIVSVGMFEHVGLVHYRDYFGKIAELLTDDGVALLQTISHRCEPYPTSPWIEKYIFPGGYIPALSEVLSAIEEVGLWVTDLEILRLHYAETLRHWRERFTANRHKAAALYDERFCRMWEFFLAGSAIGFRRMGMMVAQIQLTKAAASPKDSGQLRETSFHEWDQGATCRCVLRMTQRTCGLEVVHEPARRCHMRSVRP